MLLNISNADHSYQNRLLVNIIQVKPAKNDFFFFFKQEIKNVFLISFNFKMALTNIKNLFEKHTNF